MNDISSLIYCKLLSQNSCFVFYNEENGTGTEWKSYNKVHIRPLRPPEIRNQIQRVCINIFVCTLSPSVCWGLLSMFQTVVVSPKYKPSALLLCHTLLEAPKLRLKAVFFYSNLLRLQRLLVWYSNDRFGLENHLKHTFQLLIFVAHAAQVQIRRSKSLCMSLRHARGRDVDSGALAGSVAASWVPALLGTMIKQMINTGHRLTQCVCVCVCVRAREARETQL